jgi:hypothetical protein
MERPSLKEEAMRAKNSTLTAQQVHSGATIVLQDHLKLADHVPKCRAGLLITLLLYAAARITADLVLIPDHGQPQHDPDEIYRSAAKDGTSRFHAYADRPDYAIDPQRRSVDRRGQRAPATFLSEVETPSEPPQRSAFAP